MSSYARAWCLITSACCALRSVNAVALTTSSPAIDYTPTPTLPWCQEASSIVSYFTQPEYTSAVYSYCSSMLQIPPVTVTAVHTETVQTTEYDLTYACKHALDLCCDSVLILRQDGCEHYDDPRASS